MRKVSATFSGLWFGSMIPPDPARIVEVAPATWVMSTSGAELAMPAVLWCSASQYRRNPSASAARASSTVSARACVGCSPARTGHTSSTERAGTDEGRAIGPRYARAMGRLRTIIRVRAAVALLFGLGGLVVIATGETVFGLLMLAFGVANAVLVVVVVRRARATGDPDLR